jgi:hypothetical protein
LPLVFITTSTTSNGNSGGSGNGHAHNGNGNGNGVGVGNGNGNNGTGSVNNLMGNAYGLSKRTNGNSSSTTTTTSDALWYITVHSLADSRKAAQGQPPPNFATWMIDPTSGTSKVLRTSN